VTDPRSSESEDSLPAAGGERLSRSAARPLESAFYGAEAERVAPENRRELAECIREIEAGNRACVPAGAGAHAYLGDPPPRPPLVVSMERLNAVLRYEPEDFTIGVAAGMRLCDLAELLGSHGQELAADFAPSSRSTVGGLVAAGVPGPRRARGGGLRSAIIGVSGMRGGGREYKAGGMVVKNVAGYDVAKLLSGSMGTLGPIIEVNFKLRALPQRREGGMALFTAPDKAWVFARRLRDRGLEPACLFHCDAGATRRLHGELGGLVSPVNGGEGLHSVLWLFEGNTALVSSLQGEVEAVLAAPGTNAEARAVFAAEAAQRTYDFLCRVWEPVLSPSTSRTAAVVASETDLSETDLSEIDLSEIIVRGCVLPSRVQGFESVLGGLFTQDERHSCFSDIGAGQLVVRWEGGASGILEPLDSVARAVSAAGGSAWLVYAPPSLRRLRPYLLVPDPNHALAKRIAKVFDPRGVFCPGRVHGLDSGGGGA
jgi:FAD/FMN-containing dehydrogenase